MRTIGKIIGYLNMDKVGNYYAYLLVFCDGKMAGFFRHYIGIYTITWAYDFPFNILSR